MGAILVSKGKLKCPYFGCKEYIFDFCMKFKYFTFEGSALWFRRKNADAPPEKSKPISKAKCVHFSFGQTILWSPGIIMQNVFRLRMYITLVKVGKSQQVFQYTEYHIVASTNTCYYSEIQVFGGVTIRVLCSKRGCY